MKDLILLILQITAFIIATYLSVLCLLILTTDISSMFMISIFGLIGYVGLFLLFLEHRVNNWIIIIFLTAGVFSFVLFVDKMELWKSLVSFKEVGEWFIIFWPAIVALINIVRLLMKNLKTIRVKY